MKSIGELKISIDVDEIKAIVNEVIAEHEALENAKNNQAYFLDAGKSQLPTDGTGVKQPEPFIVVDGETYINASYVSKITDSFPEEIIGKSWCIQQTSGAIMFFDPVGTLRFKTGVF